MQLFCCHNNGKIKLHRALDKYRCDFLKQCVIDRNRFNNMLENCVIFESSVKTSFPLLSFATAVLAAASQVFISENNAESSTKGTVRLNLKPRGNS